MSGIEVSYVDSQPLHVKKPLESIIAIISYEEYLEMSQERLHALLEDKNIIVTGHPVPDHEFDERGLDFIHPLHGEIDLQGAYVPETPLTCGTDISSC